MAEPKQVDDDQLKQKLTKEQYDVFRNAATEDAGSGKYDKFYEPGVYTCVGCGTKLFSSDSKFDSGSGWPSFDKAENEHDTIVRVPDNSIADRPRVEVRCKKCDGHLGHVFQDGPQQTGERFCINSCVIQHETN